MTFDEAKKDAKLLEVLKNFMKTKLCSENYEFLMSRDSNDKLYAKYIPDSASLQINIKSSTKAKLDALAKQKKWSDMTSLMADAKKEITAMVNDDTMKKFVASDEYKAYEASKNPPPKAPANPAKPVAKPTTPPANPAKPTAAPANPAKPVAKPATPPANPAPKAPDLSAAKSAVAAMEKDMTEGTTFLTNATSTVKSKGVPKDREEVNRMFDSGRMRHDKVHNAFTALLQKDKAFTRENFGSFFTKKDAFSKLWADYRKLLGK